MKKIRITSKIIKYIIIVWVACSLLIAAGVGTILYLFPKEKMRTVITEKIETTINRKISIKELNYGVRGIALKAVTLYDDKTQSDKIFMQAATVHLSFGFFALFQGKLEINKIYVKNFQSNVIFDKNGTSNLEKLHSECTKDPKPSTLSLKISQLILRDAKFNFVNLPKFLKPLEGLYQLDGNIHIDKDNNLSLHNAFLQLPEKRGAMYPQLKASFSQNDFLITGDIKLKNCSLQWVYKWASSPLPFNIVSGDIENFKLSKTTVEGFAKASASLSNSPLLLFGDGYVKVDIPKQRVFLSDIKGKTQTSTLTIHNLLLNFNGDVLAFNINKINAFIADLVPIVESIPAKLYGKIEGSLAYNGKHYNGSLTLINAGYDSRNKTVSNINTVILIKDNLFKNENIPIKLQGNSAFISVASTDPDLKNIIVHINADKLQIKPDKKNQSTAGNTGFPVGILCIAKINELVYDVYSLKNFNAHSILVGPIINIRKLSADFANGTIELQGVINIKERIPKVYTSLNFRDIKIQTITGLIGKYTDRIYGFMSGTAKLNLELSDKMLDKLDGNIEFTIANGKLYDTGIQNGLGIWLAELKYKLKNLEFNKIYGNINISGTNYYLNSFIFNSQNIKVNVKGSFNKQLIATPLFINLEFSKYFIQDLAKPAVALGLIKYKHGDWYIIPFKHEGDISESKNLKRLQ